MDRRSRCGVALKKGTGRRYGVAFRSPHQQHVDDESPGRESVVEKVHRRHQGVVEPPFQRREGVALDGSGWQETESPQGGTGELPPGQVREPAPCRLEG